MMKRRILGVLSFLLLIGVGGLTAQITKTKKDDVILIPKDDFVDVLTKAVLARKKQCKQTKKQCPYFVKLQQNGTVPAAVSPQNPYYDARLNSLEAQLQQIMLLLADQNKETANPITYLPNAGGNVKQQELLPAQQNVLVRKDTTIVNVDNSALQNKLNKLVAETEKLRGKINSQKVVVEKARAEAKSTYDGKVYKVFFGNNKYALSQEAVRTVADVVDLLKSDNKLEVMVKGFASQTGGSLYNQTLSLQRSDRVKQALISNGVAPGRVLTTYHGEDLSNASEKEARRVDIVILDTRK